MEENVNSLTEVKINHYVPEGYVAIKNYGFDQPDASVIDAEFNVKTWKEKKSEVWIKIEIPKAEGSFMFALASLIKLEHSPIVEDAEGKLGLNENMLISWFPDEDPEFKPKA